MRTHYHKPDAYEAAARVVETAEAMAEHFMLPEGWQEGREQVTGTAFDPKGSPDPDDAIRMPEHSSNLTELEVHVADVGSFVYGFESLRRHADIRVATIYSWNRPVRPMLPRPLSEDKLVLSATEERPTLTMRTPLEDNFSSIPVITKSVLTAERRTPQDFTSELAAGNPQYQLLYRAAQNLRQQRTGDISGSLAITEEGDVVEAQQHSPGSFTIAELMIQLNAGFGRFMRENDIPRLTRAFHIEKSDLKRLAEGTVAANGMFRAFYTWRDLPHDGVGVDIYGGGSSSIRNLAHLINQTNVSAFLDGRPFPYGWRQVIQASERINRVLERRHQADKAFKKQIKTVNRAPRPLEPRPVPMPETAGPQDAYEGEPAELASGMATATTLPDVIDASHIALLKAHFLSR